MGRARWRGFRGQWDGSRCRVSDGGTERVGVTLTVRVPDGFFAPIDGGGATATLLITPNEARGFAAWLEQAAGVADVVGPPLYE